MRYIAIIIAVLIFSPALAQMDTVLVKKDGQHVQKHKNPTVKTYTYPDSLLEYVPFSVIQEAYENQGDTVFHQVNKGYSSSWITWSMYGERLGLMFDGETVKLVSKEELKETGAQWVAWGAFALMLIFTFFSRCKQPRRLRFINGVQFASGCILFVGGMLMSGFTSFITIPSTFIVHIGLTGIALLFGTASLVTASNSKRPRNVQFVVYILLMSGWANVLFFDLVFSEKTLIILVMFLLSLFLGELYFRKKSDNTNEEEKGVEKATA